MPIINWTPTVLTLTGVAMSGTNAVYSYSSYTGSAPIPNTVYTFSGFAASGGVNNVVGGRITNVTGGASGTVTIVHAGGVNETHAGVGSQQQFIQGTVATSVAFSSDPWVATLPNTIAGNVLFAFAMWDNSRSASATIHDTAGNVWTLLEGLGGALANIRANASMVLWYCVSVGGSTTVTVTVDTFRNGDLAVYEWQGPLTLDQLVAAYSSGPTTDPVLGPPVTTLFTDEEVIAFFLQEAVPSGSLSPFSAAGPVIDGGTTPQLIADATSIGTYTPGYHDISTYGCGCITTSWIRGVVALTISGNAGVAGATVTLSGTASAVTTADISGNYSFPNLAAGTYTVTPTLAFYTFSPPSRTETNITTDVPNVNFTAIPSVWTISGSAGIAGATVSYTGTASGSVVADGSGNYTIPGLLNGSYTITPSLGSYVFTPTSRPEVILNANISGVNFSVGTEVLISEVQVIITYQNPGNYLYARDLNSWGDAGTYGVNNGTPYSLAEIVLGSITLSPLGGKMFPLQHFVGYFDAVGTLDNGGSSIPDIWILPNEINTTAGVGFIQLPEVLPEPPVGQNQVSKTIIARRWPVNMINSALASQFIHHLQVRIRFEPENAPNTIKAVSFKEEQD